MSNATITFPNKAALAVAVAAAALYTEGHLPGITMGHASLGNALGCNMATGPDYAIRVEMPEDWAVAVQQAMGPLCPDALPAHSGDDLFAAYEAVCDRARSVPDTTTTHMVQDECDEGVVVGVNGRRLSVGHNVPNTTRTV